MFLDEAIRQCFTYPKKLFSSLFLVVGSHFSRFDPSCPQSSYSECWWEPVDWFADVTHCGPSTSSNVSAQLGFSLQPVLDSPLSWLLWLGKPCGSLCWTSSWEDTPAGRQLHLTEAALLISVGRLVSGHHRRMPLAFMDLPDQPGFQKTVAAGC